MAGDWIKMRSNLRSHPKVVRIASALKADKLRVIGGLHAVWCLFDEHSEDGRLCGYTPSALDDEIGFPGFADLLIGAGWLEWDGNDGLALPEFDTHNGASAKRRAQEADRKRAERAAAKDDPHDGGIPSASNADKSVTREEERREEGKEEREPRKRASPLPRPEDVTEQTWADWVQLRKSKRTTVSATAIAGARKEAEKANLSLEQFLSIWCTRGSQGLQADWLKPEERGKAAAAAPRPNADADETRRMLAEKDKGTKPPPAHIRQQLAAARGGVLQ